MLSLRFVEESGGHAHAVFCDKIGISRAESLGLRRRTRKLEAKRWGEKTFMGEYPDSSETGPSELNVNVGRVKRLDTFSDVSNESSFMRKGKAESRVDRKVKFRLWWYLKHVLTLGERGAIHGGSFAGVVEVTPVPCHGQH